MKIKIYSLFIIIIITNNFELSTYMLTLYLLFVNLKLRVKYIEE